MRKAILSSIYVLRVVGLVGCNEKTEEVSMQDLLNDKVEAI